MVFAVISTAAFIASLHLPYYFDRSSAAFQFDINKVWMASPNIHYHLGEHGISLWLVVLTTFLVPFSLIIQWNSVHGRIKEFFILMLLLDTAISASSSHSIFFSSSSGKPR